MHDMAPEPAARSLPGALRQICKSSSARSGVLEPHLDQVVRRNKIRVRVATLSRKSFQTHTPAPDAPAVPGACSTNSNSILKPAGAL